MKKIFFTVALVAIVLCGFYQNVSAAETAPNGKSYTYVYDYYYGKHGSNANSFTSQYQGKIYSNLKLAVAPVTFPTNTSYNVYAYVNNSLVKIDAGSNQNSSGVNANYDNFYLDWTESPNTPGTTWTLVGASENPNQSYGTVVNTDVFVFTSPVQQSDVIDYLTTPDVDFDNVSYNPLIPTPNISVDLLPYFSTALEANNSFVPVQINIDSAQDLYVQVYVKFLCPDAVEIGSSNGKIDYRVLHYAPQDVYDTIPLENLQSASSDISISGIDDPSPLGFVPPLQVQYSSSVPVWANNPTNTVYVNAVNNYNDYLRWIMPFYGNKMEVFVRYFTVSDTNVLVGAWRHWQSSYPNTFTEEVPESYQPNQNLPGYTDTNINPNGNTQNNTDTGYGTPTGNNQPTVIVNNNVPNYPNYPTIASYNQDDILVKFMITARQLPEFFGQFGEFCSIVLTFIPPEVWTIVGFGFLCSIVVMIIKVL